MNVQVRKSAVIMEMLLGCSAQVELCLPQCSLIKIFGEAQSVVGQFHCRLNFVVLHGGGQCVVLPPQVPQPRQQMLKFDDWKKKGLTRKIFWRHGHVAHKAGMKKLVYTSKFEHIHGWEELVG